MNTKKKLTWTHAAGTWTSCPILGDKASGTKPIRLVITSTVAQDSEGRYDLGYYDEVEDWLEQAYNLPLPSAFSEADRWYALGQEVAQAN